MSIAILSTWCDVRKPSVKCRNGTLQRSVAAWATRAKSWASCTEPAENRLGKDLAGKEIEVELFAKIDGAEERVGDATYDAK